MCDVWGRLRGCGEHAGLGRGPIRWPSRTRLRIQGEDPDRHSPAPAPAPAIPRAKAAGRGIYSYTRSELDSL